MGEEVAPAPAKAPRGRPRASKVPDFEKNYDDWVAHYVQKIASAKSVDEIEELFVIIDGNWQDIFPPDKASLTEARSAAEDRLEP